jgi:hypothetical protein
MEILNLDKFKKQDKKFSIGGKEYIIPGDLSIYTVLRSMQQHKNVQDNPNDVEALAESFKTLTEIIQIRNPDITEEKLSKMLNTKQYIELGNLIFRDETEIVQESTEKKTD